jgi:hypothetical protein
VYRTEVAVAGLRVLPICSPFLLGSGKLNHLAGRWIGVLECIVFSWNQVPSRTIVMLKFPMLADFARESVNVQDKRPKHQI